jgi:hypothetical protein
LILLVVLEVYDLVESFSVIIQSLVSALKVVALDYLGINYLALF